MGVKTVKAPGILAKQKDSNNTPYSLYSNKTFHMEKEEKEKNQIKCFRPLPFSPSPALRPTKSSGSHPVVPEVMDRECTKAGNFLVQKAVLPMTPLPDMLTPPPQVQLGFHVLIPGQPRTFPHLTALRPTMDGLPEQWALWHTSYFTLTL